MNAVLQPGPTQHFTAADYLAWDATQPVRHEFVGGEVFAMTGARLAHNQITGNLYTMLRAATRGGPCQAFVSDMRVHVQAADAYFYPDVVLTCHPQDLADPRALALSRPWLVAEVLSDSTAAYDRGAKFALYRQLPSLTHVLFAESERASVDLFRRGADGLWVLHPLGAQDTLRLDGPAAIECPVAAVYEGVRFDVDEDPASPDNP